MSKKFLFLIFLMGLSYHTLKVILFDSKFLVCNEDPSFG